MDYSIDDIVNGERDTTAGYHFRMARAWRLIGEKNNLHSPLAYSAFEFRCSIERYLFELLVLIRNRKPSKSDLSASANISTLRKTIYAAAGGKKEFERSLIFNSLYSQGSGSPKNVWISLPDIALMERHWSRLSEYCHRQLQPQKTWKSMGNKWLLDGYRLLNQVEEYLWEITVSSRFGWVRPSTMEPEMRQALNDFVQGRITQATLETRLSIMGPIIAARVQTRRLTHGS
jgi:hypothetical protein